ncbi:MAG: hypothetical protein HYZ18_06670 [Pseudogulbenkiania sp.]|nr:hypothetical protein [Pseudogulbenkiania sp.]
MKMFGFVFCRNKKWDQIGAMHKFPKSTCRTGMVLFSVHEAHGASWPLALLKPHEATLPAYRNRNGAGLMKIKGFVRGDLSGMGKKNARTSVRAKSTKEK